MAFDLDDDELRATRKLNGVAWKEDKEIQVKAYITKSNEIKIRLQELLNKGE